MHIVLAQNVGLFQLVVHVNQLVGLFFLFFDINNPTFQQFRNEKLKSLTEISLYLTDFNTYAIFHYIY